ncbi:Protein of unknown function [Bacillus toyonensis]|nr:Protein of unknown function [Bacillus toyonensis]
MFGHSFGGATSA